jgi:lanthanide-dependent methanol dehydrogenase
VGNCLYLLITAACAPDPDPPEGPIPVRGALPEVPPEAGVADEAGDWPSVGKDPQNRRYSGLALIRADNVADLTLAWSFETGIEKGHEAAPLVIGDTMYVTTPYPNVLYAFDLTKPGTVQWEFRPEVDPAAQGIACCDVVNRGAAYADGRVFYNTLDATTVAVDATTGQQVWRTRVGDIGRGETMTMAPLVVGDKVLVGNSGGELGVRGWLTALDTATGNVAWRAYSTGPDADVLIGPEFHPFYADDAVPDRGVATWPPEKWKIGGGTVWGFVSYDPELDLLYYGTANPSPWNPGQRPGDNKWTSSVFARRPSDGHAFWAYQWNPHDLFDHDGINEMILVDLDIDGVERKVLLHADRNAYLYVLDRVTGEVISADPFAYTNTSRGVDTKSGRPIPEADKEPRPGELIRHICPAAPGAKDWQPAAWSPATHLLYLPQNNLCQDEEATEVSYIAGTPYLGANVRMYAGPGGHMGELTAWDPVARGPVWRVVEPFPVWSGLLATGGGLVFYGTMDGWFRAVHASTGEVLWERHFDSGIIGQPITFVGPDGKQYVAVYSGVGGWAGALVHSPIDPRDRSAALGFASAMRELPRHTKPGGTLLVFGLP